MENPAKASRGLLTESCPKSNLQQSVAEKCCYCTFSNQMSVISLLMMTVVCNTFNLFGLHSNFQMFSFQKHPPLVNLYYFSLRPSLSIVCLGSIHSILTFTVMQEVRSFGRCCTSFYKDEVFRVRLTSADASR